MKLTTKEINIGTIFEGKEIYVQIPGVSHNQNRLLKDIYVKITAPDSVEFKSADIEFGTFNPQTGIWWIPSILENTELTAGFTYEVVDGCKSTFPFTIIVDSKEACHGCFDYNALCNTYKGYSCCDIAKCNFTKVTLSKVEEDCAEGETEPTDPPENPIEGELFINVYNDCESWWLYIDGGWVLQNNPTSPDAPTGTLSLITDTVVGHKIATHDNQVDPPVDINETETYIDNQITGGHTIGYFHNEINQIYDLRETITEIDTDVDGTILYTNEAGDDVNGGLQMASGSINNGALDVNSKIVVTFPFTFNTPPVVVVTPTSPISLYFPTVVTITTSNCIIYFNTAPYANISFNWIAMQKVIFTVNPTPTPTPTPTATYSGPTPTPTSTAGGPTPTPTSTAGGPTPTPTPTP